MKADLSEAQAAAFALLPLRTRNAIERGWNTQGGTAMEVVKKARTRAPRPDKRDPVTLFRAAVLEQYNDGLLQAGPKDRNAPKEVQPGVFVAHAPQGWGAVAADIASQLGGQGRPSQSDTGASWQWGQAMPGVIVDAGIYKSLLLAQAIVRRCIPDAPDKWSLGGCARQLLGYVGPPQMAGHRTEFNGVYANGLRYLPGNADRLLEDIEYGYHQCAPGRYEYAEHYDVSGYYFDMMCRLKSLRLSVFDNSFAWDYMLEDEWQRWQEVISYVPSHKPLRNAMAGAAAGPTFSTEDRAIAFARVKGAAPEHKADPWPVYSFNLPRVDGPFRAAGLLLVRTGYEKTLLECLTNGEKVLYSNIDSLICLPGRVPVWETFGFNVKSEWKGETHIVGRGNWKVGQHETLTYTDDNSVLHATDGRAAMPAIQFGTWL